MPEPTFSMLEDEYRTYSEEGAGYCTSCHDITQSDGVEPDARNYACPECQERTMMGLQEALIAGIITFTEE